MPACPLAWPLVLSKRWKPHLFSLKEFCFGKLMILGRLAEAGPETVAVLDSGCYTVLFEGCKEGGGSP